MHFHFSHGIVFPALELQYYKNNIKKSRVRIELFIYAQRKVLCFDYRIL